MKRRGWPIAGLCLLLLGIFVYAGGESYRRRDLSGMLRERHGRLAETETTPDGGDDEHEHHVVRLRGDAGISVTASLKTPTGEPRRYPALLILGGLRTGRRTVEYLDRTRGLVLLCLDYPYEGKREKLTPREFVISLPRIRRGIIESVPAVMLGVDYLLTRDDVDPGRIVLVGGSLGALFVPAAAALDERIAGADSRGRRLGLRRPDCPGRAAEIRRRHLAAPVVHAERHWRSPHAARMQQGAARGFARAQDGPVDRRRACQHRRHGVLRARRTRALGLARQGRTHPPGGP